MFKRIYHKLNYYKLKIVFTAPIFMKTTFIQETIAWLKTHPDHTMDSMVIVVAAAAAAATANEEQEQQQLHQLILNKIRGGEYAIFRHHQPIKIDDTLVAFFRANDIHRIIIINENGGGTKLTLHFS